MSPPTVGTIVPGKGRLNADGTYTPVPGQGSAIPSWQLDKYDPQNQGILEQLYQGGWRGEDSVLQSIFGKDASTGTRIGLTGTRPRDYSSAYGGIPTVADPLESLRSALTGNIGSLADLYTLGQGASEISAAGAMSQLNANMPLTPQILGQRSQNILSNLQGNISTGLTNRLGQIAAERGVGFGADSPATTAAYLAATGRSIEDLQSLGQQQAAAAIQTTPMGPMFNPMQFMVSPGEYQNWQQYANTLAAAPVPSAAARAAEEAARRGMSAGAGAVPSMGGSRFPTATSPGFTRSTGSWGGPGTIVAPSLGTGTSYGGQMYYGGSTPDTAANNWYNWMAGLGGGSTTGGGTGTGGGFSYMGDPLDFATYFGVSPDEWAEVGGTWDELFGGGGGLGDDIAWDEISPYSLEAFGITP